jgi:hypothetical protein
MNTLVALAHVFTAPLAPAALLALLMVVSLYTNLSARLGAVTKMPPRHRWFIVGGGLIALAFGVDVVRTAAYLSCEEGVEFLTTPAFGLFFFHIPLLLGVVINLLTAWRYWAWLLEDDNVPNKQRSSSGSPRKSDHATRFPPADAQD